MQKYWVVFDMDGVISDTQKYHGQVEAEIFTQYDITTISPGSDQRITPQWIGDNFAWVQPKERMKKIFDMHGKSDQFDMHAIEQQKNTLLYTKYMNGDLINPIPWVYELLDNLSQSGEYMLAVVTASTRDCMVFVLQSLWLDNMFDELVSIYDIDPNTGNPYISKWDPQVYQRLWEKYNISNKFVMIEDGCYWYEWSYESLMKSYSDLRR